jgi:hypothetical protein
VQAADAGAGGGVREEGQVGRIAARLRAEAMSRFGHPENHHSQPQGYKTVEWCFK